MNTHKTPTRLLTLILMLIAAILAAACTQAPASTETPATEEPADSEPAATAEQPAEEPAAEPTVIETNFTEGCVETFEEGVDYFPQKVTLEYAEGFTVEYFNHYKVVTVLSPWTAADETFQYVLVQCGTPAPEGYDEATFIEAPVSTIITMSTTYLPALAELGQADQIVGMDSTAFAYDPAVRARIDAGEIVEIGMGADVNIETVLELDPSLIMTIGSGLAEYDAYPTLIEAGLPVVINGDWVENEPLGRAEWAKFIALFYNQEAEATRLFEDVATAYAEAATLAASAESRPTVLVNIPWEGTWYVPGGQSFFAQMLADAGADYIWADSPEAGTLYLDFETVFEMAGEAEAWLNVGAPDLASLAATDERFAEFAAFQSGQVWSNSARTNASGGDDFYESGVMHPELVLADLVAILHPELLPEHEFTYYFQLPQ
jgi:iron complex transport system substrate-binding protein